MLLHSTFLLLIILQGSAAKIKQAQRAEGSAIQKARLKKSAEKPDMMQVEPTGVELTTTEPKAVQPKRKVAETTEVEALAIRPLPKRKLVHHIFYS